MSYGRCEFCRTIPKSWNGDDRKCAFPSGQPFSDSNWNCATMNILRDSLTTDVWGYESCHVGVIAVPGTIGDDDLITHVILSMYKNRGAVMNAFQIDVDGKVRPLSAKVANALAKHVRAKATKGEA